jgi:hypothetical protein
MPWFSNNFTIILSPCTVTCQIRVHKKKIPLLSMINQHFSKNYSEVICGFILMKFVSLIWEMSVILCHNLKCWQIQIYSRCKPFISIAGVILSQKTYLATVICHIEISRLLSVLTNILKIPYVYVELNFTQQKLPLFLTYISD